MSEITGKQFSEPFKMRVVSGMLVNGSIQITWATGEKSSSQIDWGYDPNVSNTTSEYHNEPKTMVRYHTLQFPRTLMDTEHFFRVRSRTVSGKVGQSPIYSVIVPKELRTTSAGRITTPFQPLVLQLAQAKTFQSNYPQTQPVAFNSQPEAVGSSSVSFNIGPNRHLDKSRSTGAQNLSTTITIQLS